MDFKDLYLFYAVILCNVYKKVRQGQGTINYLQSKFMTDKTSTTTDLDLRCRTKLNPTLTC